MTTLAEAKYELQAGLDKGTVCPCCDRYTKRYKRKLNGGMCVFLGLLADASGSEFPFIHALDIFKNAKIRWHGDYSKLRFWGLIEPAGDDIESGLWRITQKGKDFVSGQILVPTHIFTLNNKLCGHTFTEISFDTGLRQKFDKKELLTNSQAA